jgi:peptidoglycan hydrolase-like protein with peptidoglycan-binding domain
MTAPRRTLLASVVLALLAGAGGGWLSSRTTAAPAGGTDSPATGPAAGPGVSTATVVRTDLRTTRQYYGTIGFGSTTELVAAGSGRAYTWLPAPGAVIRADQPLYEVDGRSVPVLSGSRPMWRTLQSGLRGPDVAQLNTALAALGYAPAISGSQLYSWRTKAAVRKWQRAHRLPVTGAVEPGQLVFASLPLRVAGVHVKLGAPAAPGEPLLSATAPGVVVDLPVAVDQAYLLHRGAPVTVTLPDAVTQTSGTVAAVSRVATLPDPQAANVRRGNPDAATIGVTITLRQPQVAAAYSSAPVSVAVTVNQVRRVLAVPVAALLARPGGRFAVTVVNGSEQSDVPVTTGLYSDTMVQVSGPGIAVGAKVLVAAL